MTDQRDVRPPGRCRTRLAQLLPLAFVLLAVAPARAQAPRPDDSPDLSRLSLEELADLNIDSVYGASAYLQKVTEAPSSVTIITADDIERHGYLTLADALRGVRGFYITNDRNYSYLGVRGFSRPGDYNSRVLLLIDGHRLNDNIFESALIGSEFPLDLELIQRIEIIRGPSSSLYGTSAIFGVINVITRHGDQWPGLGVAAATGTQGVARGHASYGERLANGATLLLSGSSYSARGGQRLFYKEFDRPETNDGVVERADGDAADHLFGTLTAGPFTLQGLYGTRDKAIPTASFGTIFNDPRARTVETQGYVNLHVEQTLAHRWHLGARASYNRYRYDGDYPMAHEDAGVLRAIVNKDLARGDWWGTEVRLTNQLATRHTVTVGGEYRDNLRQDQFNYDEGTGVHYLDDRRDSTNWALYVQDEIPLHRTVRLNVGLRHDHYETFGGTTNPRVGVIVTPRPTTAVKLLYGRAFRTPNAYELFWSQADVTKANPTLRPETTGASEVAVEHYLGSRLQLTATGFHYAVSDLVTQQNDPADDLLVYNNAGSIGADGVELELQARGPRGMEGRAAYTYQRSRDERTGQVLSNSPPHLAQVAVTAPVSRRLVAGLEVRRLSPRQTLSGGLVARALVTDVTLLGRGLPKGLRLSAAVLNLFNGSYADPGSEEHRQDSIVQDGRTLRITVSLRIPRRD